MIKLMFNKKYLNISEVAKMLQIEEHKIRYWDSEDPRTNKKRIEGISTKSKGGTRYFNRENIKKLQNLKKILYDGENQNYSIKLADKILNSNSKFNINNELNISNYLHSDNDEKIKQILNKMRILLKNNNRL